MTPFILMIALSMHSIFEGIALGLEKSTSNTINILIAITLHKWAASMSLGISLNKTFPDEFRKILYLIITFACATPLGIIFGLALGEAPAMVDITFSCLAGGTFIYIACSEVIVEEFSLPGHKWFKLLVFLLGAGLITSLWFLDS
jgi:zinc transporter 1/2/3